MIALKTSAVISQDGQYRYELRREGVDADLRGLLPIVMLNASTADHRKNDPTIKRCCSFAERFGYGGIIVGNAYGLRATKPTALWTHPDPVGPENDEWLARIAGENRLILCAWGADAKPKRVKQVVRILTANGARLYCLGTNKSDGSPRHPLYVRGDQPLIEWSPQ